MSLIPNIINKNQSLKTDIINNPLKDLPSILKNNTHKHIFNIYDSGWEYYSQGGGPAAGLKNALLPTTTIIKKILSLDIPDALIPYIDANIIMQNPGGVGGESTGYTGIHEGVTNDFVQYIPWMKAYLDGKLVFEGVARDLGYFSPQTIDTYYKVDSSEYTTMLHKFNVWTIDAYWTNNSTFGDGANYRMVNAEVKRFDLPSYTVDGHTASLMSVLTTNDFYGYPPTDWTYDYQSGGSNYSKLTSYTAMEITSLTESNIIVKGTEAVFFSPFHQQNVNTEKNFSLNTCSLYLYGIIEVEYQGQWYKVLNYTSGVFVLGSVAAGENVSTVVYKNARLAGYYPCFDERKLMRITYSPFNTNITDFISFPYGSTIPGIGDTYVTGSVGTQAYTDSRLVQSGTNTNSVFLVELNPLPLKIGQLPFTTPVADPIPAYTDYQGGSSLFLGNKNFFIFKNPGSDRYSIQLYSRVVGLSPANKMIENLSAISGTFSGGFLQNNPLASDFVGVNGAFFDTGGGAAFFFGGQSDVIADINIYHDEPIDGLYIPSDVDVKAKILIDVKNPFYYNAEQKVDKK